MVSIADVSQRLTAYIYPNVPETLEQVQAFSQAVTLQSAYETAQGDMMPANVKSFKLGEYALTLTGGGAAYTAASLCPGAWAVLFNAGLLKRGLPMARRV